VDRRAHAIEDIYRSRYGAFRAALTPLAGSQDAAHDVVQEAFARAFRRRRRYRGDGPLEAWIWKIAVRTALEFRRNGRPRVSLDEPAAEPAGAEAIDPELAAALRGLSPRRKLVVFLRYFADLSYAEIAEACGLSEGTVAATLAQARASLHDAMKEGATR
jgi:RNA polymerase sigma-70 factor (ECF subfamily)